MKARPILSILLWLCLFALTACEEKSPATDTPTEVPPAEANAPDASAEQAMDMAKQQVDAASDAAADAGPSANAPLRLKLDDQLIPATKFAPMPRLDLKPGELKSPLGTGKKNMLPTQQ